MNHSSMIALSAFLSSTYGIEVSPRHAIHRALRFATLAEADGDTAAAADIRRAVEIANTTPHVDASDWSHRAPLENYYEDYASDFEEN